MAALLHKGGFMASGLHEIAKLLFRSASTAQKRYDERRKACRRRKILDNRHAFNLVREKFLEEQ